MKNLTKKSGKVVQSCCYLKRIENLKNYCNLCNNSQDIKARRKCELGHIELYTTRECEAVKINKNFSLLIPSATAKKKHIKSHDENKKFNLKNDFYNCIY